ncbi:MAG: argininosuccinate lyase [Kiritimatiellae bacterium]|jgi:argininosuccinate lyase|nr:argininosuccinate lyase [Kiritimatiellia bacterium]
MKTEKTITGNVDPDVLSYTVGDDPILDLELAVWDCIGTAAHVTMLSEMSVTPSVVTADEASKVKKELAKIIESAKAGDFTIEESDQDVHMAVERRLTETLGDLGKKIHTGRSRNDQVAVDVRLHIKDQILALEEEVAALSNSLVEFGKKYNLVPMVGRTHLQPAMPSSIGVWASGHAEMILDQISNIEAAYKINDACPLGSAAGYGVPLPLNRERTSSLLGFARPLHNVFGASMARGEDESALLCALAQLMAVLSRLAQDVIIFSMPEFGYFTLPRAYCTGSSIMPQKYNPDVMELVRSKTATVLGLATSSLSMLHAMPGGYNRDLQDCKGLYMKGLSITRTTLRIMAKFIDGMGIDEEKLRAGFIPGVFATDVALRKVAEGTPWREAYHAVRDNLEALSSEDPDAAVQAKTHEGATAGLNWNFYENRISDISKSVTDRRNDFNKKMEELLG